MSALILSKLLSDVGIQLGNNAERLKSLLENYCHSMEIIDKVVDTNSNNLQHFNQVATAIHGISRTSEFSNISKLTSHLERIQENNQILLEESALLLPPDQRSDAEIIKALQEVNSEIDVAKEQVSVIVELAENVEIPKRKGFFTSFFL